LAGDSNYGTPGQIGRSISITYSYPADLSIDAATAALAQTLKGQGWTVSPQEQSALFYQDNFSGSPWDGNFEVYGSPQDQVQVLLSYCAGVVCTS
jgi:hypothetical protein